MSKLRRQTSAQPSSAWRLWVIALAHAMFFTGCGGGSTANLSDDNTTAQRRVASTTTVGEPPPTVSGDVFQSDDQTLRASRQEWPTEAFAESAISELNALKSSLLNAEPSNTAKFFDDGFRVDLPFPSVPKIFSRGDIVVFRARVTESTEAHEYVDGSASTFTDYLSYSGDASPPGSPSYLKIKVVSVNLGQDDTATTDLRAESHWESDGVTGQTTTEWTCQWSLKTPSPRLSTAALKSVEAIRSSAPTWLIDVTGHVLTDTDAISQLSHGLQHWLSRIETAHGMNYFSKHGIAVADVNGDGLDDVYICQPGGLPNRLLIQRNDGTVADQGSEFGLDMLDRTSSAVFVDLDNDGDQDAALATLMGVIVLENVNNERFKKRERLSLPDIDLYGISAVDFDNDGDLDLYQLVDFASDTSRASQGLPRFIYHNAQDGGANHLMRNEFISETGNSQPFQFVDVTRSVGLDTNNRRHSLAAAWCDFDSDGDQDLYVANDYGPNSLYQNNNGNFVDVAEQTQSKNFGSGMSVSWGDYDRDGRMDLYVGNMYSSAGSRLTTQRQFLPDVPEVNRRIYEQFAQGNTLLRSDETTFRDLTSRAGVGMGRWSWSSLFADLDNDGWQDILVANGYITTFDSGDL